ncbi:hypothetical protein SARC_11251, partial [Sphaeroforma arctica JP610]
KGIAKEIKEIKGGCQSKAYQPADVHKNTINFRSAPSNKAIQQPPPPKPKYKEVKNYSEAYRNDE